MLRAMMVGAALLVGTAACSDDETTAPGTPNRNVDSRLVTTIASTLTPTSIMSSNVLSVSYSIRNETGATAETGTCGSVIEARPSAGGSWTDVSFTGQVCTAQVVNVPNTESRTFGIMADMAKVRAVAPVGSAVVFRVAHPFINDRTAMSGEVTWTVQ
jgi:hypothetical protein